MLEGCCVIDSPTKFKQCFVLNEARTVEAHNGAILTHFLVYIETGRKTNAGTATFNIVTSATTQTKTWKVISKLFCFQIILIRS